MKNKTIDILLSLALLALAAGCQKPVQPGPGPEPDPEPVPEVEADYEYELTEFSGEYTSGYGNSGEDNYYVILSDRPVVDNSFEEGGAYYLLELYAEAGSGQELPAGTYTLGVLGETLPMTFSVEYSGFILPPAPMVAFSEGTLEVAKAGEAYVIEGNLSDTDGATHHFVYSGNCFPPLPESIECVAVTAGAGYLDRSGSVMEVAMQFTDMSPGEDGIVAPPGTLMDLDIFMPFDADGGIATGTYEVSAHAGAAFTVAAGYDLLGTEMGSYLSYSPSEELSFMTYYISSGTVEISGGQDSYSVSCELMIAEGIPVTCSYEGPLVVSGVPGPMSTLTGDCTVNLTGADGLAYYYGDYFGTGGNWVFLIGSERAGDRVRAEIVAEASDFSAGIPSGTYRVSVSDEPEAGEFVAGRLNDFGSFSGTWYTSWDEAEVCTASAPAVGGTVEVVNHGDGSYDIVFDCTDDLGYVWSGSWSGEVDAADYSYPMTASTKSGGSVKAYAAYPAKGAKTVEEKAEIVKSNGFKLAHPVAHKTIKAAR